MVHLTQHLFFNLSMAKTAQEIFGGIQDIKKQQKDIRGMIRDALTQSSEYQQTKVEMDALREKKRISELKVRSQFEKELSKLDDLKIDLESELEELSDLVLTQLLKGEIVKVRDAYNATYDVTVKVAFKKSDEQAS